MLYPFSCRFLLIFLSLCAGVIFHEMVEFHDLNVMILKEWIDFATGVSKEILRIVFDVFYTYKYIIYIQTKSPVLHIQLQCIYFKTVANGISKQKKYLKKSFFLLQTIEI